MTYSDRIGIVLTFQPDGAIWLTVNEQAFDSAFVLGLTEMLSERYPSRPLVVFLRTLHPVEEGGG